MTVSHSTELDAPEPRVFPALKVMERQTPPLKYGLTPYWRAPVVPASHEVYIPAWNWSSPMDFPEGESVTVLGVNASYLAAMSGDLQIGHSHLVHTGPYPHLPSKRQVRPGYYRITSPYWAFRGTIVHPLGDSARVETETDLWVAAPTLALLLELAEEGHLGWFEIIDSWTAEVATDFHAWAERLRSIRGECLDRIEMAQTETRRRQELARFEAFEQGYTDALHAMLNGKGCLTWRPDWTHTIYAQRAAAMWRAAWRWTFTGRSLVAMGAVEDMAVLSRDIGDVIMRPEPPFRYDPTGRRPGALKPKKITFISCQPAQRADQLVTVEDHEEGM